MDFFWFKIDNMLKILYARQVLLGFKFFYLQTGLKNV